MGHLLDVLEGRALSRSEGPSGAGYTPEQRIREWETVRGPRIDPESTARMLEGLRGPLFPLAHRVRAVPWVLNDVAPLGDQLFGALEEALYHPDVPRAGEFWSPGELDRMRQELWWRELKRQGIVPPPGGRSG